MLYTELNFLFFIIVLVLLKLIFPRINTKSLFMFSSLFWYYLFGLNSFLIFLFLSFFNIVMFYFFKMFDSRIFIFFWVLINLIVMILLKMNSDLINFNSIGLSFFCFSSLLSIKESIKLRELKFKDTLNYFILTPFFFPALVQGPLEPPQKILKQLDFNFPLALNNFTLGFAIILLGFLKYHFIYSHLYDYTLFLFKMKSSHFIILASLFATISAYTLMSSYCDIGRGVSKIFGIDLAMNFRPIIWAKSPVDYWNRWNISLGYFLKEHVTFPLMLRFGKIIPHKFFVLLTFIIFGLWHGVTWIWFVFGIVNGIYIILYSNQTFQNFMVSQNNISQKTINYFFVLLIIVTNGLLTNHHLLISDEHIGLAPSIGPIHYSALILFLFLEYKQRDLNTDFLKLYNNWQLIVFNIVILSIGLYSFFHNNLFSIPPSPPLYFKF